MAIIPDELEKPEIPYHLRERYSLLEFFTYKHLPPHLQEVSRPFCELAVKMAERDLETVRGWEVSAGLRKLLEAKDCFVRACLPRRS